MIGARIDPDENEHRRNPVPLIYELCSENHTDAENETKETLLISNGNFACPNADPPTPALPAGCWCLFGRSARGNVVALFWICRVEGRDCAGRPERNEVRNQGLDLLLG